MISFHNVKSNKSIGAAFRLYFLAILPLLNCWKWQVTGNLEGRKVTWNTGQQLKMYITQYVSWPQDHQNTQLWIERFWLMSLTWFQTSQMLPTSQIFSGQKRSGADQRSSLRLEKQLSLSELCGMRIENVDIIFLFQIQTPLQTKMARMILT